MALQSNAFAIMQQNRQKQNDIWHDDFFSTMNNKVWAEPTLFWEPGMANIEYTGLEAGNPTESWATYANAAKSRGIRPDYQRFMETYNSIKGTRGTKILDKFQQLQSMYSNNKDFQKALKQTMRANPKLRKDLSEGVRLNPEHGASAAINLAFQDFGQDAWEGAKEDIYEGIMGDKINPLALGPASGRMAAKAGAAAIPWMAGRYTTGQALGRTLMPGGGFMQAADVARGLRPGAASSGPLKGIGPPSKTQRLRNLSKLNQARASELMRSGRGTFGSIGKTNQALAGISDPELGDWRGKSNQKKIRGWKRTLNSNLRRGIKDLERLKGSMNEFNQKNLDKKIKSLKAQQKELNALGKNKKRITKKAFNNVLKKNIAGQGQKTLAWAVSKVGWGGILKRAGWRLGGKILLSGIMKAATPLTYGASGLISAGMDAMMVIDIMNLVKEISKEYEEQDALNKGGSIQQGRTHQYQASGKVKVPKWADI